MRNDDDTFLSGKLVMRAANRNQYEAIRQQPLDDIATVAFDPFPHGVYISVQPRMVNPCSA